MYPLSDLLLILETLLFWHKYLIFIFKYLSNYGDFQTNLNIIILNLSGHVTTRDTYPFHNQRMLESIFLYSWPWEIGTWLDRIASDGGVIFNTCLIFTLCERKIFQGLHSRIPKDGNCCMVYFKRHNPMKFRTWIRHLTWVKICE